MVCMEMLQKMPYKPPKRYVDEFKNVSHVFINDNSRYIATFSDLKKK